MHYIKNKSETYLAFSYNLREFHNFNEDDKLKKLDSKINGSQRVYVAGTLAMDIIGLPKHRGPDWSGLHKHRDCFLAYQCLAIIDPAFCDQPIFNKDKSVVFTVNGEIYNHEELRKKFVNHKF